MIERSVRYFEQPGSANTQATLEAVRAYLHAGGDAAAVIVASISGKTATKVKEELGDPPIPVICIAGAPCWWTCQPDSGDKPMSDEMRSKLSKSGVVVVNSVPSPLTDGIESGLARYGYRSPSLIFTETLLAVGGYGLKTAVECVLMATDGGYVEPFRDVIAIAGTGKGADTAVVARSTFSPTVFSANPERRLVVKEILAVPRNKVYYKTVGYGELKIEETD